MFRKALITALIIGSSSVALAYPDVRDHRQDDDKVLHDHSTGQYVTVPTRDDRPMPWRWGNRQITLADNVSITSGFRDHRGQRPLFIDVNGRMANLSKLRLDLSAGRTYIDSIVVMLPNGTSRTYSVKQMLSFRSPSLTIDLDQRAITGIYIYGASMRGSFDVVGMTSGRRWGYGTPGYSGY